MKPETRSTFTRLLHFLDTRLGQLLFGFLVTTVGGAILSEVIQKRSSENEHVFEIYKIRLAEAKALQGEVIRVANARSFHLRQIVERIAHPQDNSRDSIDEYWERNVGPTKDAWNRSLYDFYARAQDLFSRELAEVILDPQEDPVIIHDPELDSVADRGVKKKIPVSLHGAFVDAHATVYRLWRAPQGDNPDRDKLLELAVKQLEDVVALQGCLADTLSAELENYPYRSTHEAKRLRSEQCIRYRRGSAGH